MEQNIKNHRRFSPLFHFILIPVIVFYIIYACTILVKEFNTVNALFLGISLLLLGIAYCARTFALAAQDRAIRAEETLRYFSLTGKLFPKELRLSQIISLRFAADEEIVALADKAVKEHLTSTQIKNLIINWRPDFQRV